MKKIGLSLSILLLSNYSLRAQRDSTVFEDSLQVHQTVEKLLEQTAEDSPILDVLNEDDKPHHSQSIISIRSRLTQELQQSAGYMKGAYLGSSLKSYQRVLAVPNDKLSGGVLLTKDAGEQRLNEFTSWSVTLSNIGYLTKAVIGNYRLEAGQGISLWRGYDFSKGSEVITPVKKVARGLISSLSTDEVEYFNGAAANLKIGSVSGIMLYSKRSLSASVDTLGNVTSIYASGYFRTQSEQSKRDNLTEKLYGAYIAYRFSEENNLGLTFYRSKFSLPLFMDEGRGFSGNGYTLFAADYNFVYRAATLFGEWACTNSTMGGISGILLKPADAIAIVASYRSYPYKFLTLHGLGFGEQSSTSNERGFYLGMRLVLMHGVVLSSYFDQFVFPGSSSKFATSGNDALLEIETQPTEKLIATLRYRRKSTDKRSDAINSFLDYQRLQSIRLQFDFAISSRIQLRGKAERVILDWKLSPGIEKGLMVCQDLMVKSSKYLWLNLRVTFFRTDSYATRIYDYERDMDGVLAMPALYGTGVRWYGLVRYSASDHLELSAKYSDIIRDDVKHIGSGLDELPTNHDNRIGVQMDLRF